MTSVKMEMLKLGRRSYWMYTLFCRLPLLSLPQKDVSVKLPTERVSACRLRVSAHPKSEDEYGIKYGDASTWKALYTYRLRALPASSFSTYPPLATQSWAWCAWRQVLNIRRATPCIRLLASTVKSRGFLDSASGAIQL